MSISLTGLTRHQVQLLNHMWSIEEVDDLYAWQSGLDYEDQQQVDLLINLIHLSLTDELYVEDTTQAQQVLSQFRL